MRNLNHDLWDFMVDWLDMLDRLHWPDLIPQSVTNFWTLCLHKGKLKITCHYIYNRLLSWERLTGQGTTVFTPCSAAGELKEEEEGSSSEERGE